MAEFVHPWSFMDRVRSCVPRPKAKAQPSVARHMMGNTRCGRRTGGDMAGPLMTWTRPQQCRVGPREMRPDYNGNDCGAKGTFGRCMVPLILPELQIGLVGN